MSCLSGTVRIDAPGDTLVYIDVAVPDPKFVQYWWFESDSAETRNLSVNDYAVDAAALDADVQIFPSDRFELWLCEPSVTGETAVPPVLEDCPDAGNDPVITIATADTEQFVQYWWFASGSNTRDLSINDYLATANAIIDETVQIFPSDRFELWLSHSTAPPPVLCYLTTSGGAPLYTGGEEAHLLLPGSCDG
jgi:hypothetical protein